LTAEFAQPNSLLRCSQALIGRHREKQLRKEEARRTVNEDRENTVQMEGQGENGLPVAAAGSSADQQAHQSEHWGL